MTTSTDFITISVSFFQQINFLTLTIVIHFLSCDPYEHLNRTLGTYI